MRLHGVSCKEPHSSMDVSWNSMGRHAMPGMSWQFQRDPWKSTAFPEYPMAIHRSTRVSMEPPWRFSVGLLHGCTPWLSVETLWKSHRDCVISSKNRINFKQCQRWFTVLGLFLLGKDIYTTRRKPDIGAAGMRWRGKCYGVRHKSLGSGNRCLHIGVY